MVEFVVQNIVASAVFGMKFDIDLISSKLEGCRYDRKRFPGIIYKLTEPKTAILIFSSGKTVITGAKSVEMVHTAMDIIVQKLRDIGVPIEKDPEITVQNIVSTSDLGAKVNLNAIAITLGLENVEYEPEQFPGLVYRVEDPKVVMLIFTSGKVVCTGAKATTDTERALNFILNELQNANLI